MKAAGARGIEREAVAEPTTVVNRKYSFLKIRVGVHPRKRSTIARALHCKVVQFFALDYLVLTVAVFLFFGVLLLFHLVGDTFQDLEHTNDVIRGSSAVKVLVFYVMHFVVYTEFFRSSLVEVCFLNVVHLVTRRSLVADCEALRFGRGVIGVFHPSFFVGRFADVHAKGCGVALRCVLHYLNALHPVRWSALSSDSHTDSGQGVSGLSGFGSKVGRDLTA